MDAIALETSVIPQMQAVEPCRDRYAWLTSQCELRVCVGKHGLRVRLHVRGTEGSLRREFVRDGVFKAIQMIMLEVAAFKHVAVKF